VTARKKEPPANEAGFVAVARGRVQGVGYRAFVVTRAEKFGLKGTVRNLPGGGVEVRARGSKKALDGLLADMEAGPMLAKVTRVDVEWSAPLPAFSDFRITHCAD
jgi:acylphosphatase